MDEVFGSAYADALEVPFEEELEVYKRERAEQGKMGGLVVNQNEERQDDMEIIAESRSDAILDKN
jgi:hypothetical protein